MLSEDTVPGSQVRHCQASSGGVSGEEEEEAPGMQSLGVKSHYYLSILWEGIKSVLHIWVEHKWPPIRPISSSHMPH